MRSQRLLAYLLKGILAPFFFLPRNWKPIPLCNWYGKLGINVPPLVGHASAPTVTTGTAGSITTTTATISGNNITNTGGENPSERGVAYSTINTVPTTADSTSSNTGSFGTGAFNINLSGLPSGTVIYFRAYAINSGGTGYGTASSFTTTSSGGGAPNSGFFQLI